MLKKIPLPRYVNWLLILFVIQTNYSYKYWKDDSRIIAWDAISYYAYLPAAFIYHDLSLEFADNAPPEVKSKIWYGMSPANKRVIKTSSGLAFLYSPFFALAHIYTKFSGDPSDGYSVPYRIGLIISSIFYFGLGLFYMRKTLSLFYSKAVVICCCIAVGIGTNLFYYVTVEPTMSHSYGFFLLSAFVWFTIKWYQQPTYKLSAIIGLLTGIITLVRPPNVLILLFFILWGITSFTAIKDRMFFFIRSYKHLLMMAALAFLIWIPQLLYWKMQSGHLFYNSYGDTERFFFNDPKIIPGLFSYRKGWLLYTPVMSLALIGIFFLRNELRNFFLPVLIFFLLNIYVLFSWWSWWYGGGFGGRALIDSYALMAIPLGAFLMFIFKKGKVLAITLCLLVGGCVYLNLFQTEQFRIGVIHWDAMSKRAYWANFGRLTAVPEYEKLLEPIDYDQARKGIR